MTDMPRAGFLCSGKTPLALSVSVHCAYKMMDYLRENGFSVGACHTEITEPYSKELFNRAKGTLKHICDNCELVITVGCDGFSVSDIMPDITEELCKKRAAFFPDVLNGSKNIFVNADDEPQRLYPDGETASASFAPSRASAGIYGKTLILNFPGNIRLSLKLIAALMPAVCFTVYNLSGKSAVNSCQFRNFANSSLSFHEVFKKEYIVNN